MPIYSYRCETCGHEKEILQKLADDPLTVCPSCQRETFGKQLTAPGLQCRGATGNSAKPAMPAFRHGGGCSCCR